MKGLSCDKEFKRMVDYTVDIEGITRGKTCIQRALDTVRGY